MPTITSELLKIFPFPRYADPASIQRGREYYRRGKVWNLEDV